jgi:TPP-dependent pyruvate/acetoin dehydrogenase alpha subunit
VKTEVEEEISAAIRFAEESPYPAPEDLYEDVIGD